MSPIGSIKVLSLALVAALAFSVIAAGAAQAAKEAPVWTVGGKTITAAESQGFTAKAVGAFTLDTKVGFTLTSTGCSVTGEITGSSEGTPGINKEVRLTCTAVEVEEVSPAICQVHSPGQKDGTAVTENVTSTLVWLKKEGNTEAGDLLKGIGAEERFVTLEITGASCPVKGSYPVTGTAIAKIEPVGNDLTTGKLLLPKPPIEAYWTNSTPRVEVKAEMKVKALTASLTGEAGMTLNSDESFGVELG